MSAKINFNSNSQPNKTESEPLGNIQSSASPLSKEHQIVPVSILVYTEYSSLEEEFVYTIQALDDFYKDGSDGPEYYYENLTDYTDLDSALPGHDILLIPEQNAAPSDATLVSIGSYWSSTLNSYINDGGIVISMDNSDDTHLILNETGLFTFYGVTYRVPSTITLVNDNDALAREVNDSWTAAIETGSFDTTETESIVEHGPSSEPIVIHKIIGHGHLVVLGFDLWSDDANNNYAKILGNAIRLHRHVLFDASHQYHNIHGGFSSFADDLVSEGFAVSSMDHFNPAFFAACDVLVLTIGDTTYNSSEVDAIEAFVKNGGGLFITNQYWHYGFELDPVLTRFGFIRNITGTLHDSDDNVGDTRYVEYNETNIINHSITLDTANGVEFYAHSGFISIPNSAVTLISTDTDGTSTWVEASTAAVTPANGVPVAAAVVTEGNGRVAVCGDTNFLRSDYNHDGDGTNNYYDEDNAKFAVNNIRWLSAAGVEECVVLFDESKVPVFHLSTIYDTFGHYLTMNGYTVKWMSTFNPYLVNDADILFICSGSLTHSVSEINLIFSFVKAGGGLYLVGQTGTAGQNINSIALKYGMTLNTSYTLRDSDDEIGGAGYIKYEEANLASHPITLGIKRIEVYIGTGLTPSSSGTAIINTDTDDTCFWSSIGGPLANGISIMQAMDYKNGRVILFTDYNLMEDGWDPDADGDVMLFDSDNELLMVNSFQWLSEAGIPPIGVGNGDDDDDEEEVSEFPWLLLMLIIGAILGITAIVAIILILKKKR